LLIGSLIPCIDRKSLVFKMVIVTEEMFLFKEFVFVWLFYEKYIEFGGL